MLTLLPKDVYHSGGAALASNFSMNFWKIWNDPNGILRAVGETDNGKSTNFLNKKILCKK